jgi:transcriptional antiterminator NusG
LTCARRECYNLIIDKAQRGLFYFALNLIRRKDTKMGILDKKNWYVVQTYSGHEDKVKQSLEERAKAYGMEDYIFRVEAPQETVITQKNGENVEKQQKVYSGYVIVEMIMSDEAWYIVRNTPGVTGFVGSHGKGSKPVPMYPHEVDEIFKKAGIKMHDSNYAVGDEVKIIGGAFAGTKGDGIEVDENAAKLIVNIDLFGRATEAEVDFVHVDKA